MQKMTITPLRRALLPALALVLCLAAGTLHAMPRPGTPGGAESAVTILGARPINATTVELLLSDHGRIDVDFYSDATFRLFQDKENRGVRDPEATPPARILADNPRLPLSKLYVAEDEASFSISTGKVCMRWEKASTLFTVTDLQTGFTVIKELAPVAFADSTVTLALAAGPQEYFYGGGVQNGRFSHKGHAIAIENQNEWEDGGVASPAPFYWSTKGYGLLWHTFARGGYDFGGEEPGTVKLSHQSCWLDVFFMVASRPEELLSCYYQLTGKPVLLPKFGFYEGHLNAYNRDYWKQDETGILFEDGKRYKESEKDTLGIRESLNGENDNYQFSARAVIDRYRDHDMPLGWLLPNDGYGAGYGQTGTLLGNVQNLRALGLYARAHGVQIGLWTQSDLHPNPDVEPLLQRDIVSEVRDGLVRVLKTDVAWVGDGYSFGLNGIAEVARLMPYYGNDARPFIITLDGWAGTQRYAGVWSGDQKGGEWEYIRFHIPTYIGAGLSGQPNITSDMDGIFGGKNPVVNTRDFQWKAFTPMQLNMDGWGLNEKYPHALGEPAASINRFYLKLKSELLPYTYTYAKTATEGLPLMRAICLDTPNDYTLGTATRYQYMYGDDFLVAPVYKETDVDEAGNDTRDLIYLPQGEWVDYFNGELYPGGRVISGFEAPLWKLPLFVKRGAIIPMNNPNNNVSEIDRSRRLFELYPYGHSFMEVYDDDGVTEAYQAGASATTLVESDLNDKGVLTVTIHPTQGAYEGMAREQTTELAVNVTEAPGAVSAQAGGKRVKLTPVSSLEAYAAGENVYFYEAAPNLNRFATPGSDFSRVAIIKNPQLHVKLAAVDITADRVEVTVKGYRFDAPLNTHVTVVPEADALQQMAEAEQQEAEALEARLQERARKEAERKAREEKEQAAQADKEAAAAASDAQAGNTAQAEVQAAE